MKTIKIFLFLSLGFFLLTSCEKNPDLNDLDGQNTVITNHKKDANFKQANYSVSDSIMLLNGDIDPGTERPQYWIKGKDLQADKIIAQVEQNMNARGYTERETSISGLNIRLAYIEDMYYFASYTPFWWNYWFDWYGWYGWYPYYPYPVVYTYTTGSLVMDMIDMSAPSDVQKPIIWDAYMTGLLTGDQRYDGDKVLTAIDEAFKISPYVSNK